MFVGVCVCVGGGVGVCSRMQQTWEFGNHCLPASPLDYESRKISDSQTITPPPRSIIREIFLEDDVP